MSARKCGKNSSSNSKGFLNTKPLGLERDGDLVVSIFQFDELMTLIHLGLFDFS